MENVLKKLFVVLLLCLVQSAVCHADTFKGKIVNAETGGDTYWSDNTKRD